MRAHLGFSMPDIGARGAADPIIGAVDRQGDPDHLESLSPDLVQTASTSYLTDPKRPCREHGSKCYTFSDARRQKEKVVDLERAGVYILKSHPYRGRLRCAIGCAHQPLPASYFERRLTLWCYGVLAGNGARHLGAWFPSHTARFANSV